MTAESISRARLIAQRILDEDRFGPKDRELARLALDACNEETASDAQVGMLAAAVAALVDLVLDQGNRLTLAEADIAKLRPVR